MSEVVITFRAIDLVTPVAKSIQASMGQLTKFNQKMGQVGQSTRQITDAFSSANLQGFRTMFGDPQIQNAADATARMADEMKRLSGLQKLAGLKRRGIIFNEVGEATNLAGKRIENFGDVLRAQDQGISRTSFKLQKLQSTVLGLGLSFLFFGMMLSKVFRGLIKGATQFYNKITEGTTETSQALAGFAAGFEFLKFTIGEAIGLALEPLLPLFFDLVDAIADFIDQNPELAGGLVVAGAAIGLFMMTAGQLILFFAAMISTIANVVIALGGVGGAGTALSGVLGAVGAGAALLSKVFVIIFGVVAAVIGIFSFLISILEGVWDILNLVWKFITQVFTGDFAGAFDTMVEIVREAIKTFLKLILLAPLAIAEGVFKILNHFTGLDLSLTYLIDNLVDMVLNFFAGLIQGILDIIGPGLTDVIAGFSGFIDDVIGGVMQFVADMVAWFMDLITQVTDILAVFWDDISAGWDSFWTDVVTSAQGVISKIQGIINNLVTAIKNPINGLINDAFRWGKNLIDVFANGIRAGISDVTRAVDDVLSSVSDFMPSSPAKRGPLKNLLKWGESFVSTFNQGAEAASMDLHGLENLAPTAGANIAPVGVPEVGAGTQLVSGNTIDFSPVINVDATTAQSPEELEAFFENLIDEFWTTKMRDFVGNTGGAL